MKINPEHLYDILVKEKIDFFTGVPDSTLKHFGFFLDDKLPKSNHIIAANEGNSIGIAAGYYLSTGNLPLVYMQNSGFGNALNPLTSLADNEVFGIPMIIMLGWRGEPGKRDAIQHLKDGRIQTNLLDSLEFPYSVLTTDKSELRNQIKSSIETATNHNTPFILLVRRDTFDTYSPLSHSNSEDNKLSREESISLLLEYLEEDSIVVCTTGKASRELYELRGNEKELYDKDFLMIGSMGHASSISLGITTQEKDRNVYCIDGDGALIMHMGSLSTIGKYSPSNFRHIILNNYAHDSVGGQESNSDIIDYSLLSKSNSYKSYFKISTKTEFKEIFSNFKQAPAPSMLEIIIRKGSRKDLGRPISGPKDNKKAFMKFLGA